MTAKNYKLIPMSEITDDAREIAVAWMECDDKDWIGQKHKLASDIMNYAKEQCRKRDELIKAQEELIKELCEEEGAVLYIKKLEEKIEQLKKEIQ